MVALSHKAKQYGWFALKVFILSVAFIYIYRKIVLQDSASWGIMFDAVKTKSFGYLFLFFGITIANWFFEIKKWQTITSVMKKISFFEASKQSLAALTVSLATPNRIGDYGAKVFYFEKQHRKKIVLLNFVSNAFQLLTTLIFGIVGLFLVFPKLRIELSEYKLIAGFLILVFVTLLAYLFRKKEWFIKGFTIKNVWNYFQKISFLIKLKTFIYSIIRYLIFSSLFYLLLQYFGANTSFLDTIPFITSMYLVVSILPMFLIFDVIVRGSIAVWLLSVININETVIITTVFTMWLLNFILPAIFGSIYVINFKRV
ncbi:flippase-like domain-containing protein [Aureisphaera sp. CAU 1614]|uniref:Flippase-like domain-containing protein n=1 Tax=Halomarinibacterium sedimenti TaxID=2857106 RepID=A0A9X1JUK5_9FLAO|nr:lysylphosphatidylglycerol synthase domain-containing protein [Halomarinibacterium sedimenti]MBW2936949.1 flippase-like domain-containing protein [Halomarinibacterium sedimenti]